MAATWAWLCPAPARPHSQLPAVVSSAAGQCSPSPHDVLSRTWAQHCCPLTPAHWPEAEPPLLVRCLGSCPARGLPHLPRPPGPMRPVSPQLCKAPASALGASAPSGPLCIEDVGPEAPLASGDRLSFISHPVSNPGCLLVKGPPGWTPRPGLQGSHLGGSRENDGGGAATQTLTHPDPQWVSSGSLRDTGNGGTRDAVAVSARDALQAGLLLSPAGARLGWAVPQLAALRCVAWMCVRVCGLCVGRWVSTCGVCVQWGGVCLNVLCV